MLLAQAIFSLLVCHCHILTYLAQIWFLAHTVGVRLGISRAAFSSIVASQVLLQHISGRQWRRPAQLPGKHSEMAQLLHWFWDSPDPRHHFSLHNLVATGQKHG